eukprot:jgi/Mesvir1/11578/Mv04340-RA.1
MDRDTLAHKIRRALVLYLLALLGFLRTLSCALSAMVRFNRRAYEVDEVVLFGKGGWARVTKEFNALLKHSGGNVLLSLQQVGDMLGSPRVLQQHSPLVSLTVDYWYGGNLYAVTYDLERATGACVRFPPKDIKPVSEGAQRKVLSASIGAWFNSDENVDVTDLIARLRGPSGDFYEAADIPQHLSSVVHYLESAGVFVSDAASSRFVRVIYSDGKTLVFHPDSAHTSVLVRTKPVTTD